MTSQTPTHGGDQRPKYADRAFRSPMGVLGGVLLLGFGAWLVGDAVVEGTGRTPALALAWLLLIAPLVIAFTLRPAVYVSDERMRVRNPFRTITIPWAAVERIEARYSTEVVAGGDRYQLYAVPVSMHGRKRADRRAVRAATASRRPDRADLFDPAGRPSDKPQLSYADQTVETLRDYVARHAADARPEADAADRPVTTRWAYELYGPALLGAIAVIVLTVA